MAQLSYLDETDITHFADCEQVEPASAILQIDVDPIQASILQRHL